MWEGMEENERRKEKDLAASTARLCWQLLSRSDLDALAGASRADGGSSHAILDLLGHGHESLLDVGGALGRGLQEGDGELISEFLLYFCREEILQVVRKRWCDPRNVVQTRVCLRKEAQDSIMCLCPHCRMKSVVGAVPWQRCTRRPSCWSNRSCFRPTTC